MENNKLEFYAYERIAGSYDEQAELDQLWQKLQQDDDAKQYHTHHMRWYDDKKMTSRGHTVIHNLLPELYGLPMNNLAMAYIHTLRPSAIRITRGEETTDAWQWRVTVRVDEENKIREIHQEVEVGYGCGANIDACLRAAKNNTTPKAHSGGYFNIKGMERVDFT